MFDLTPSERRGALVLVALVLLGALWDLMHLRPATAPPSPDSAAFAPVPGEAAPAGGVSERASRTPLDLNAADARELDALPGIGPVLASRIVAHRAGSGRFRTVDELLAVRGIGPRLLERIRPLVAAGGGPPAGTTATVHNATATPR